MSDEPSDAQKLIAEVTELHQFIRCNASSIGPEDHCSCGHRPYGWIQYASHLAAKVDKALGGLNRTWAAVFPDGSYMTPYHEVWNFHPNKSARELAEGDVAEYEDTTLKAQWVSGWTVTE